MTDRTDSGARGYRVPRLLRFGEKKRSGTFDGGRIAPRMRSVKRIQAWLSSSWELLFPTLEQDHPELRLELERVSRFGLRVIGGICIGGPVFLYSIGLFALPSFPDKTLMMMDGTQVLLGIVAVAASYRRSLRKHARALGLVVGGSIALLQSVSIAGVSAEFREMLFDEAQYPAIMAMVMLIGMASLPLKPMHVFGLGLLVLGMFVRSGQVANGVGAFEGWDRLPLVVSVMVVLISTGLTTVMYQQRARAFLARLRAEQGFEALKQAQVGLLLARTAASKSRFAAAMSHEINSPLGALSSAFETLAKLLTESEIVSEPKKREALEDTLSSGRESSKRLNEIANRMRRLTNLDREEEQIVDLNQLCTDTMDSLRPQLEPRAQIDLSLAPVPNLRCRPTQVSAVVSNLIRNANAAIGDRGRIGVKSGSEGGTVWFEVEDDGVGIEADRLETLFEPEFRVVEGRVSTTNWGLFVSQSIISEHGGTLSVSSVPGTGTTARVEFPIIQSA